jgi:chromate reductase
MKVLGISGSLRKASMNSALLRAAQRLAPEGVELIIFDGVAALPLFNPDLEANLPGQVQALHMAVAQADALLIASPEYAHGVTGAIKNTLDWLVSFEPVTGKHVMVWNASPRAQHADPSLREILHTMSLVIVEAASGTLPFPGPMRENDIMEHAPVSSAIRHYLIALRSGILPHSSV